MATYVVRYEVEVEADTPERAAHWVADQMRDPEALRPILLVDGVEYDTEEGVE